jgi:glycerophosphoryl diester phosphodiesterase
VAITLEPLIAHRGAAPYAPENTFAAFEKARELGARSIEFG